MNYRIWFLYSLFLTSRCFAGDPVAIQILESLEEYQQTLNSLDVQYIVKDSANWQFDDMERQPFSEWRWVNSGRKNLLTKDAAIVPGATSLIRTWASFDGENGYAVYYFDNDQTVVKQVDVTPAEPIAMVANQRFLGVLGWSRLHQYVPDTLLSLLRNRLNELVCTEQQIDDQPCWRILLGNVGAFAEGGPDHEVVAWFSKRHDLLPRRIAVLPLVGTGGDGVSTKLPEGSFPSFVDAVAFREVEDHLFKKSRWFPSKIQYRNLFSIEVTVNSVIINGAVEPETFVPDMPVGTEVITFRAGATSPLKHYVGGEDGARLHQARMREFNNQVSPLPSQSSKQVDASPPMIGDIWKLFVACSVFLIVAAIFAAKRRGRSL